MKATEQYLPVALFIILYKVVLAIESVNVNEILNFDYSNESYGAVLFCGVVLICTFLLCCSLRRVGWFEFCVCG